MSRLYDRILAGRCRPIAAQDVWDIAVEAEPDQADWYRVVEELHGRPATDADVATQKAQIRQSLAGSTSMDVVAREEVDNAVVISAEEVADYVTTLDADKDLVEIVDRVAPPFAKMFVEFQRRPNNLKLDSWGVLLSGERNGDDGWALRVALVGEWKRGHPVGPLIRSGVLVDASGHIRSSEDIANELFGSDRPGDRTNLWPVMTQVPDLPEETTYRFARSAFYLVAPALFAISLMHCKNVVTRPVDPPERLSRKHERKHGRGLTRYYVLDIAPMRQILDTEGEARTRGLPHALHICRGHFKTFTEEAPLFGKRVGTYWWPAHVRGTSAEGTIDKDYRLRLDSTALGEDYRAANEVVTVRAEDDRPDDPDTSQRGLRAHNRTQNLLARAIEAAGFVPRSPKQDEPNFDVAWKDGDTTWVAEVKSVTNATEEQQMRLAIGQVIRYRERLGESGGEVRAMIALERMPVDESWIDLCAHEGIALVWPEVMAQALSR